MSEGPRTADRRREILAAATRAFDRHGYAGATIDSVATEAGIAKGSVYNYFRSKQDLFAQVCAEACGWDHVEAERVVAQADSAGDKLQAWIDFVFSNLEEYTRITRLVLEFWATAARQQQTGELMRVLEELDVRGRDLLAEILAGGVQTGEFRPNVAPEIGASLILATIRGLLVQSVFEVGRQVDAEYLAALKRGLLAALRGGFERPKGE